MILVGTLLAHSCIQYAKVQASETHRVKMPQMTRWRHRPKVLLEAQKAKMAPESGGHLSKSGEFGL
jgi:hypothetical protein